MSYLDNTHTLKLGQAVLIVWHIGCLWGFSIIPLPPQAIIAEDTVWYVMQGCHAGQGHHIQPHHVRDPLLHANAHVNKQVVLDIGLLYTVSIKIDRLVTCIGSVLAKKSHLSKPQVMVLTNSYTAQRQLQDTCST